MSFDKGKVLTVRDAQQCALQLMEMHMQMAWKACYPQAPEATAKSLYHPPGSHREIGQFHLTKVGESQFTGNCSTLCWRSFVRDWQRICDQLLKDIEAMAMGKNNTVRKRRIRTRSTEK